MPVLLNLATELLIDLQSPAHRPTFIIGPHEEIMLRWKIERIHRLTGISLNARFIIDNKYVALSIPLYQV